MSAVPSRVARFAPIILGGLLLLQTILAVDSARRWTPTHDEYWHLPLGLHAWRTGDLRADPINPPLPRLWAALPLWLLDVDGGRLAGPPDTYRVGDAFLQAQGPAHRARYALARWMLIPGLCLGGLVVAAWAGHWWGRPAALLAACLWAGTPVLLVHASLVAHDYPVTLATLLTLAATAWYRERPRWSGPFVIGTLCGVAVLSKLSALNLVLILPGFWLLVPGRPHPGWLASLRGLGCLTLTVWIVCQLGYLGDTWTTGDWSLIPKPIWRGLARVSRDLETSHPVFWNGEWRLAGFRGYYLGALWCVLPLGLWAALALNLTDIRTRWREPIERRRALALLWVAVMLLVPPSLAGNQLGVRYVLPVVPVLILLAARAAQGRPPAWRRYGLILCGLTAVAMLRHHPDHFSAWQELIAGEPREHLVDSNLDWGQDLHALRDRLAEHPEATPLHLAYFGTVSPSSLGLEYRFPPPLAPTPGWHALSVSFVAGRPHHLRDLNGQSYQANLDDFGYFRFFQPTARIGSSIVVYHLTEEDIARYYAALQLIQSAQ